MENKARRVVLILVEGTTDATTLFPLKEYIRKTSLGFDASFMISFKPVKDRDIVYNKPRKTGDENGDVFTRKKFADLPRDKRLLEIGNEIAGNVEDFLDEHKLSCEDIAQIIQITDMDGAYIPDDWIKPMTESEREIEGINMIYNENSIHSRKAIENPKMPKKLHQNKRDAIDYFFNTPRLLVRGRKVPYKLFFMSCNLEHFYHDKRNCFDKRLKGELADTIVESYSGNIMEYAKFIRNHRIPELQISGLPWIAVYGQSWYIIRKRNENSLKRCSNVFLVDNLCKELTEKTVKEKNNG